jgi:hypothetical protein
MSFFSPSQNSLLFIASQDASVGWLSLILGSNAKPPAEGFALDEAFPGTKWQGSFVFATTAPDLSTAAKADAFVDAVVTLIARAPSSRVFMWLTDPQDIRAQTVTMLGIRGDGALTNAKLGACIARSLTFELESGAALELPAKSTTLTIGDGTSVVATFSGSSAPAISQVLQAEIDFEGPHRGVVRFAVGIARSSLLDDLRWGFQCLYPDDGPVWPARSQWYPLAAGDSPASSDQIGFEAAVDPADLFNQAVAGRTRLTFTGTNYDRKPTRLLAAYRTAYGHPVTLTPVGAVPVSDGEVAAGLVFARGQHSETSEEFFASPAGDFVLSVDAADAGTQQLLCGLAGTETFSFRPAGDDYAGDRLRFRPQCAAFAPKFPFATASPLEPAQDPKAKLLDSTYLTSWASVLRPPSVSTPLHYVSQPRGASLFGKDALIHGQHEGLLGFMDVGTQVASSAELYFPLVPYAQVQPGESPDFSADKIAEFEAQVLAPTRRRAIAEADSRPSASLARTEGAGGALEVGETINTTTPSGLVATVDVDGGHWETIHLAQNNAPPPTVGEAPLQMAFDKPDATLQQAFQTTDLFAVMANATHLGAPDAAGDSDAAGDKAAFRNQMSIEEWVFRADVGSRNRYDDYSNVVIFKGVQGALIDLVENPKKWTQAQDFAAPTTLDNDGELRPPDPSQMVILSQWLSDYFDEALTQSDAYFDNFNRIVQDPQWTGILVLHASVADIPADLAGLAAGIDSREFYAHHFGIDTSHIDGAKVAIDKTSSMFGLIHYLDPAYEPSQPASPVQPSPRDGYDFKVLSLRVLFENSAVKDFSSYSQLTLERLFGDTVEKMGPGGNDYNTVVLEGTYQSNDGHPSYSLSTTSPSTFIMNSNVLRRVEIDTVQLSTQDQHTDSGGVAARFTLTGFKDFGVVDQHVDPDGEAASVQPFDVFSFGNAPDQTEARTGLSFSQLGLNMISADTPGQTPVIVFDAGDIAFDLKTSTSREGSLFEQFALSLEGLVVGGKDHPPAGRGFLQVTSEAPMSGVSGQPWYGLNFRLDLGTPGALAGKAGLDAHLLVAWAPGSSGSSYKAMIGLELPGTGSGGKLLSLETVLKLSVGQLRLIWSSGSSSDAPSGFLLTLSDIALKFLGLLKLPPNGSTAFYLFGNPNADGHASRLGWYAIYNQDVPQDEGRPPSEYLATTAPKGDSHAGDQ